MNKNRHIIGELQEFFANNDASKAIKSISAKMFKTSLLVFHAFCQTRMILSFSALASLTAFSTRCCSSAFCLLSCVTALSLSIVSVRFYTKALSRSFSAFCLSSTNTFVRFSTSLLTASGKAFFMRSFSAASLTFSFSTIHQLQMCIFDCTNA